MRRALHLWRLAEFAFVRVLWMRIAGVLGGLRPARQVIEDIDLGSGPLSGDVAVFAHFDRNGEVRPHVQAYLQALRDAGCRIVFVTNSGALTQPARAVLAPLCARVLVRRNRGYDFGAWRDALDACGLLAAPAAEQTGQATAITRVLLVNDSVYGPLVPLAPILDGCARAGADVVGLTESWQGRFHLQSYFLAVRAPVLRDPAWAAFWATVRPAPSKALVILRYEIGLSQALLRAGFSAHALFGYAALLARASALRPPPPAERDEAADPIERARDKQRERIMGCAAARTPLNPTSDLWRELLDGGFPFVKRELLRDNPTDVHDVADLLPAVRAMGADTTPIERDLRRVLKRTSP